MNSIGKALNKLLSSIRISFERIMRPVRKFLVSPRPHEVMRDVGNFVGQSGINCRHQTEAFISLEDKEKLGLNKSEPPSQMGLEWGRKTAQGMRDGIENAKSVKLKNEELLKKINGIGLSNSYNYGVSSKDLKKMIGAIKPMEFEIPKAVKVGGVIYKVREKDLIVANETSGLGSCDYDKSIIELKTGMSQTRKEQVFMHELTHAILFEAGFSEHDEDLVERFAIVAHQVFKDNWNTDITEEVTMTYGGEEIARNVHIAGTKL